MKKRKFTIEELFEIIEKKSKPIKFIHGPITFSIFGTPPLVWMYFPANTKNNEILNGLQELRRKIRATIEPEQLRPFLKKYNKELRMEISRLEKMGNKYYST